MTCNMALNMVFLLADGEQAYWLLLPSSPYYIMRHITTRKHLFLHPEGGRSGLPKQKKDHHQH